MDRMTRMLNNETDLEAEEPEEIMEGMPEAGVSVIGDRA
jgi:hypothetical protein